MHVEYLTRVSFLQLHLHFVPIYIWAFGLIFELHLCSPLDPGHQTLEALGLVKPKPSFSSMLQISS